MESVEGGKLKLWHFIKELWPIEVIRMNGRANLIRGYSVLELWAINFE